MQAHNTKLYTGVLDINVQWNLPYLDSQVTGTSIIQAAK